MTKEERDELVEIVKKHLKEMGRKNEKDAASIVEEAINGKSAEEENFSVTENGALAHSTTGKPFVDFIFNLNAFRKAVGEDLNLLVLRFKDCYHENPELAWKLLFYIGDVREGAGERKAFFECLKALIVDAANRQNTDLSNEIACMIMYIPEYIRWDMMFKIFDLVDKKGNNSVIYDRIISIVYEQYNKDLAAAFSNDESPVSLLGKWMPSINASSIKTRKLAKRVMTEICRFPDSNTGEMGYRKSLSLLRSKLKVVEKSMTAREWSEINYSAVPSKASLNLREAFRRHDGDRYNAYIEAVSNGKEKINAAVTEPHEIIAKIRQSYRYKKDQTLVQIWKNLGYKDVSNTIVVADTSGSMNTCCSGNITCMDVALGLAIYTAERLRGPFHNKFIEFSSRPSFVKLNDGDIYDKLNGIRSIVSNTDIEAVFILLSKAYCEGKASKVDMPKNILILSDMQFDEARSGWCDQETLFDTIKRNWYSNTKGEVPIPKLIFWNLDSRVRNTIPLTENENGLILMSGFSTNMLSMAMSGKFDPFEALLETLNSKRYEKIGYEYACSTYDHV